MSNEKLKQKIWDGLHDDSARIGRDRALGVIKPAMLKMTARYPDLRDRLHNLKKNSIAHLDELLTKTVAVMEERGCKVLVANTAQEALDYISQVVGKGLVVKSKTNAGKEISM